MKLTMKLFGVALLGLSLAGCFNGNGSSRNDGPDVAQSQDFTQFVKDEINNTNDTREAVNINDLEFSFNDQTNEQAFDELF
ncbi:MAG: hypothetical protein WD623_10645 [Marinobacter sp.]|uniref:hypothetical protein n=1 Tax=Marinobacter sp. TaxID=50741 RepID=UPI0034A06D27